MAGQQPTGNMIPGHQVETNPMQWIFIHNDSSINFRKISTRLWQILVLNPDNWLYLSVIFKHIHTAF